MSRNEDWRGEGLAPRLLAGHATTTAPARANAPSEYAQSMRCVVGRAGAARQEAGIHLAAESATERREYESQVTRLERAHEVCLLYEENH